MASQLQALAILLLSLSIAFFYPVSCHQPYYPYPYPCVATPNPAIPPTNGGVPTIPPVLPPIEGGGNPTIPPTNGGVPTIPPVSPPMNGGGNPTIPPTNGGVPTTPPVSPPMNGGGNPTIPPRGVPTIPPVSPPMNGGGNPITPPTNGGVPTIPPRSPPILPPSNGGGTCPRDRTLKLGLCVSILKLVDLLINRPPSFAPPSCCSALGGLVGLDASACLCTAIKLNVLHLVHVNTTIGVVLKLCGIRIPPNGVKC